MRNASNFLMIAALTLSMAVASFAVPGHPDDPSRGAYLGVMVDKVSPETAAALHLTNGGTTIANVDQDGPACHAGLKGGDVVTAFNSKPVSGPDQFASMIHSSAPGTTVTLTVWRSGHSQEIKVKLGSWTEMAGVPTPRAPLSPVGTMPFAAPAPPAPPDVDIHIHTPMIARSGVMVEPLSPQLCDFFGVPPNKGVLVRSVEKGSAGAAAGLKAGDVIVRVNDETIHDMADWKRALNGKGKLSLVVVRDKKEQSLQMSLPTNSSELKDGDWDSFERDMQALSIEMQQLGPEFERDAQEMAKLDSQQFDEIHRQAEASARTVTPEMKKQAQEMRKQAEQMRKEAEKAGRTMTPEMKRQAQELHKEAAQMEKQAEQIRKEVAKMTPEMARTAREMADSMKPTAKELNDMARDMAQQWKAMQPELQQQMQELKKEMEQEKREWQEIFKGSNPKQL